MLALFAAALLALAPAEEPDDQQAAALPVDAPGEWILLQYYYPGPTLGPHVDYWVSVRDYGAGPNADGLVRVRVITPLAFNAELRPTRFIDVVREIDCVNRRERTYIDGTAGDWEVLPDFVPGARTIFSVCSPGYMNSRAKEPDLATAIARSQELERQTRTKVITDHD